MDTDRSTKDKMQEQEMQAVREEGVTIGEVCRMVLKHIWAVLISSVLFAVVLTLGVGLLINPLSREYSMEFYFSYPASDTFKYPDGSDFSYYEFISYDALSAAKASDEQFGSVDIDGMLREDDISVTPVYEETENGDRSTGNYTIAVSAKYFPSRETAQDFIHAIAQVAIEGVVEKAQSIGYSIDEEIFAGATFEERLALLRDGRASILEAYDVWIAQYRTGYAVGGKTLSAYRAEAAVTCGDSILNSLQEELDQRGYVTLEQLEIQTNKLMRERVLNEQKIAALRELLESLPTTEPDNDVQKMIADLEVRNIQIDSELESLNESDIANFSARVQEQYERLQDAAENVQAVAIALYEQESTVYFSSYSAEVSGGIGLPIAAVGGFIVAFLIAAIVVCSVENKRAKERRQTEAAAVQVLAGQDEPSAPWKTGAAEEQAQDEEDPEEHEEDA